jgi:hypothetical protein
MEKTSHLDDHIARKSRSLRVGNLYPQTDVARDEHTLEVASRADDVPKPGTHVPDRILDSFGTEFLQDARRQRD